MFDFGGVIITSIANQVAKIAADHDVDAAVVHEILLGPRASGPDHPWHRAERGEIAVADIQPGLGRWAKPHGVTLRGDEIERLLTPGEYVVVDAMVERIQLLRSQGIATGLLTNTFAEFRPTMQRDIDFVLFDAVIESFAVGARKPETAIYQAAMDALDVDPTAIVYLDDFDQNLEPAHALGWTTIHVTDPVAALAQLDALLRYDE